MPEHTEDIERTHVTEPAQPPVDGFLPGRIVGGKYKIVTLLGTGGIGNVYKVEQIFLSQNFALKTLNSQKASDQMIRRFQNEARTASSLNHPNLVKVNDFGLLGEQQPYLVMDYVDGITLSEYIKTNGVMNLEQVVGCFAQVCLGLSYAHEQGIVHRDIKPSNIMISRTIPFGEEGFVKVVDFGIAKLAYAEDGNFQALTTTGEIFGSPLYMSPEQCSGSAVDHRADIYSLGCVLFEVLTGTTPFVGQNALSTMMLHQSERVPTLKEVSLGKDFPPELEVLVQKLLAKSPSDRYQNLGVVANDLAQIYKGAPVLGIAAAAAQKKPTVAAVPITMSRRKFQTILLATAASAALVSGSLGYFLGGVSSNKAKTVEDAQSLAPPTKSRMTVGEELETASALPPPEDPADPMERFMTEKDEEWGKQRFETVFYDAARLFDAAKIGEKDKFSKILKIYKELEQKANGNHLINKDMPPIIQDRIILCNVRLENYGVADDLIAKQLEKARTPADKVKAVGAYAQIAEQLTWAKDPVGAFKYYKKGADTFLKISRLPGCDAKLAALCRRHAGNFLRCCSALSFQSLNKSAQAIELGYKAKSLLENNSDDSLMGNLLLTLGAALSRDKQYEKARPILLRGEKCFLRADDPSGIRPFLLHLFYSELSTVEKGIGQYGSAREWALRARDSLQQFKAKDPEQKKLQEAHTLNINNLLKELEGLMAGAKT